MARLPRNLVPGLATHVIKTGVRTQLPLILLIIVF